MIRAIQQLQLGRVLGSERQARATLEAVRQAGFEGIELDGFMIRPSSLLVRALTRAAGMPAGSSGRLDWPRLVRGSGLRVVAIHEDLGFVEDNFDELLAECGRFGTDRVVITGMYRFDYRDPAELDRLCGRLVTAAARLEGHGLHLLYHNHNSELLRTKGDGERAFDVILRKTEGSPLAFELDTYWLAEAGADALGWMRRLGPRLRLWHINDRGTRISRPPLTPLLKSDEIELGQGAMPLETMLGVARQAGVEAVVLETHRGFVDNSPLESLRISGEWLTTHVGRHDA